jgi:hypothetical protein
MVMNRYCISLIFLFLALVNTFGQEDPDKKYIKEMKWGRDFTIYLEMANDSSFVLNVKELFHSGDFTSMADNEYIYYPASLDEGFLRDLKKRGELEEQAENEPFHQNTTLWGTLHHGLGGGWAHFINCFLYAMERGYLNLEAPLLKRPETSWKPDPVTESYKRTRKWEYYIPVNQKLALKEYAIRKDEGNLADLNGVPEDFLKLFLSTSPREYNKLRKKHPNSKELAKIDLVKILLGAKYLGTAQISYIKTMVLKAAMEYSVYKLPSVIIIDEFDAAVAMSLDEQGYKIEKVVFENQDELSAEEVDFRKKQIHGVIQKINRSNREKFKSQLSNYYKD